MNRVVLGILEWVRQYRGLRPPACRFAPTCSDYALEAVRTHGTTRGLYLGFRRILRCHPFGGHGHDPVPRRRQVMAPVNTRCQRRHPARSRAKLPATTMSEEMR